VKLRVLYAEDGHIVSLCWVRDGAGQDDAASPAPPGHRPELRCGIEPGKGQRVALVDVDASWHDCRLSELHQRFTVADHGQGARPVERRS
jgi:hypothetical protein